MERPRAARWRPRLRAAALLLAWVALAALAWRPSVEPAPAASGAAAWAAMALVVVVAWWAPGYAAWRLIGAGRGRVETAAFSFGLGLAFLLLCASLVLPAHATMRALLAAITVGSAALALGHGALAVRESRRDRPAPPPAQVPPGPALALAATAGGLMAVATFVRGFTFGGDEWFHLRAARQFLEVEPITDTMMFDAWSFVVAALVRLAGVELLSAYDALLVPFLVAGAALAYVTLARQVLRRWSAVALAFALQALLCLSDMHTRGEGAGMALLARVMEDKYAGLLVAVPLALAALLAGLRSRRRAPWVLFAVLALAAVMLQPLALFWIGLPAAALLLWRQAHRRRPAWSGLLLLAALGAAALGLAQMQRALRPSGAFQLLARDWPFNAQMLEQARRQLLILSLDKGWFMAHPALLAHPLAVAALAATVPLARRFRRSLSARFLVCAMALPPLLAFNPVAATWLGGWITPWMVHRLIWAMPLSLVLGAGLHRALRALGARWGRPAMAAAAAGLLAAVALLLWPRIGRSLEALEARNRVFVTAGEQEVMRYLSAQRHLRGMVLAPVGVGVRLPAWTSRLQACPGQDAVRSPGEHAAAIEDCRRLLKAARVDDEWVGTLRGRGITHVLAANGSVLDRALAPVAAFQPLFRGHEYSFYAWRPDQWPPPRP